MRGLPILSLLLPMVALTPRYASALSCPGAISQPSQAPSSAEKPLGKDAASQLAAQGAAKLEEVASGTVIESPKEGLKYVWIPSGTFPMGCSPRDRQCQDEEKPRHRVTLSRGFWIGQTEVTLGAYKGFARATGRAMPGEPNLLARPLNPGWTNEAMPIVGLTWEEAQAFCRWAGGQLPTEAQWEYAARAGSTASRYGDLNAIAWDADNSGRQRLDSARIRKRQPSFFDERLRDNGNGMHEVGQKRPNRFGLFDMLGNVWEWVEDWYDPTYFHDSPLQDPAGPSRGQVRVVRGGSWYFLPRSVRASYRGRLTPHDRFNNVGCRCVRDSVSR